MAKKQTKKEKKQESWLKENIGKIAIGATFLLFLLFGLIKYSPQEKLDVLNCTVNPREDKNCECTEWEKDLYSGYISCEENNGTRGIEFTNIPTLEYSKLLED